MEHEQKLGSPKSEKEECSAVSPAAEFSPAASGQKYNPTVPARERPLPAEEGSRICVGSVQILFTAPVVLL